MKTKFPYCVTWCNISGISGEAAGEIWNWSLLGVKGLSTSGAIPSSSEVTPHPRFPSSMVVHVPTGEPRAGPHCEAAQTQLLHGKDWSQARQHVSISSNPPQQSKGPQGAWNGSSCARNNWCSFMILACLLDPKAPQKSSTTSPSPFCAWWLTEASTTWMFTRMTSWLLQLHVWERNANLPMALMQLCLDQWGFPSASTLACIPLTTCLTFLGVQLDMLACSLWPCLTTNSPNSMSCSSNFTLNKVWPSSNSNGLRWEATVNWASRIIYGGHTFLCRILDMLNAPSLSDTDRLGPAFHCDIGWWVEFLSEYSVDPSHSSVLPSCGRHEHWNMSSGSRGSLPQRLVLPSLLWILLGWLTSTSTARKHDHSLAALRWCKLAEPMHCHPQSDNQAVVQMINKATMGNPKVMQELCTLVWLSAIQNFHITAVYLASHLHEPDHLRCCMQPFSPCLRWTW